MGIWEKIKAWIFSKRIGTRVKPIVYVSVSWVRESSSVAQRNVAHAVVGDREPSHTRLGRGERSVPFPL